jgi:small-conductance mechanosensitive channel
MRWSKRQLDVGLPDPAKEALRTLDERIKPDFRRAIGYGIVPIIALIVGKTYGGIYDDSIARRLTAWGCALAVLVFGVLATRAAANELRRISEPRAGTSTASGLRVGLLLIGYLVVVLCVLDLLDVPLGKVLVGGAVTGIILGIAAQQVLGNLFAGLVLLFARPYVPGARIRIYSGSLGGPHDGIVTSVGLLYISLQPDDGPLINIPNSGLLASAVGPAPDVDEDTQVDEEGEEGEDAPSPSAL